MAATVYEVKLKDRSGKVLTQVVKADNAAAARQKMRGKGQVMGIREKVGADPAADDFMTKLNELMEGKVKLKAMMVFTRQFATMINAGVSMVRSLGILTDQTESLKLRKALAQTRDDVEQGVSLSDALAKHNKIFDNLYIGMVRAGEAGGMLDSVLSRVAGFLEAQNKLNNQIKSAMAYPITVCVFAGLITIGMLKFIIPMFASMFEEMGAKLPAFTQFLVDASNFMSSPGALVLLLVCGALAWGFFAFKKTPKGAFVVDQYALKLPLFGDIIRKASVARFSRTLGTLLKSGVPLLQALEIVRDSIGNLVVAAAMEDLRISVSEGESLAKPLEKAQVFPPMVVQMVAIGEETGAVDAMLEKIADFYDDEVENAVKALTSMLEPLMMVGIGGIVGSIIIGMYLPIFDIVNQIK